MGKQVRTTMPERKQNVPGWFGSELHHRPGDNKVLKALRKRIADQAKNDRKSDLSIRPR